MAQIKAIAIDVDGTLTDGKLSYSTDGAEVKSFHVADGLGIVLAQLVGIQIWIISGRQSATVDKRMAELRVRHVRQGIKDKRSELSALMAENDIAADELAYIGDDINDLPAFSCAGTKVAVCNAVPVVQEAADYVTIHNGGDGAVREAIDWLLSRENKLTTAINLYLSDKPEMSQ